jgi:DNA-binding IclR family transcriptional regulator
LDAPTSPDGDGKPYYTVSSLEKGFAILELLARNGSMGVSEVARALGHNRSVSNRFLATLRDMGYLSQDEQLRYRLTLKMFNLGNKVVERMEIRSLAKPYMRHLVARHQETVNLACMENDEIVVLEMVRSNLPLKYDLPLGTRGPAYATALGKAILAHSSEEARRSYFDHVPIRPLTARTAVDSGQLEDQFRHIRSSGFSEDEEEWTEGLCCLAAPIFGADHTPHFALSMSGPVQRIRGEKKDGMVLDILRTTAELSALLGA